MIIKRSKKGATLVELIVAVVVIALVVAASVSAIVISQNSVFTDTKKEEASMKAQGIADEILVEMSGKPFSTNESGIGVIDGAKFIDNETDFPKKSNGNVQYIVTEETVSTGIITGTGANILGTKIHVAVFYNEVDYIITESFAPESVIG